jgi:hypothetical protein
VVRNVESREARLMANPVLKYAVRAHLRLMRREHASRRIARLRDRYLALAEGVTSLSGATPVPVPRMPGLSQRCIS